MKKKTKQLFDQLLSVKEKLYNLIQWLNRKLTLYCKEYIDKKTQRTCLVQEWKRAEVKIKETNTKPGFYNFASANLRAIENWDKNYQF